MDAKRAFFDRIAPEYLCDENKQEFLYLENYTFTVCREFGGFPCRA